MLFLQGLVIGLAIAAPVGPIGVLCIQRSLCNGFRIGLMTGLGAALADGTYGLIAGFGLTAVSSLLIKYQHWIRLLGGIFLLYLGIKLILSKAYTQSKSVNSERSSWHAFTTTYFLTLTNPLTILSFIAIFAGLGLGTQDAEFSQAVFLVLGIILGSAVWWLLLSGGVAYVLHKRINSTMMQVINYLSGVILIIFGLVALLSLSPLSLR